MLKEILLKVTNEGFKKDIKLITRLRKEFWEPFARQNKDVTFKVKNIDDGVEIISNNIDKFDDALGDFLDDNEDIEISTTTPRNGRMTIKTYG